jgi:MFS family permease
VSFVDPAPELSARRPRPSYKWWVVGMLWFICFFNYADRQAISSVLKLLESEFHFNKTQQGSIVGAFAIIYAITAPFAGQVGDRYHRKTVILAGLYIWSLVTGLTAACSKVTQFVLVRGAEGLGETFYFPASMSLISDYHSRKTRSRAMGLHQTSVYAGTVGGGALAALLGERLGWRYPFIVFGGLGILLGLVLAAFVREPERNEAERLEGGENELAPPHMPLPQFLRVMADTPTLLILILAFAGANTVAGVFLAWTPTYLTENFELSVTKAGVVSGLALWVPCMAGSIVGGLWADRWRLKAPGGRILSQAFGMILGAPFIVVAGLSGDLSSGHAAPLWIAVIALVGFGFFKGVYDANIWASMYDVVPPARRGTTLGIANMLGWAGAGIAAPVFGRAVDYGIPMSTAIAWTSIVYIGVGCLLISAGLKFAPRDIHREDTPAESEKAAV